MSNREDGKLDAAIDRAVREMLDVEPPAGLRGRVVERIERPRHASVRSTWVAAPVAAAIVVLAIILPSRGPADVPVHDVVAATAPRPAPLPKPVASAAAATTTVPAVPDRRVRTASASRAPVATSAPTTAASDAGVERLAPIDPIGIVPVRSASIAPSDIAITPLTPIAALQLEPLSPPDRR